MAVIIPAANPAPTMNNGLLRCVNKSINIFGLLEQYVDSARKRSFQQIYIFSSMLFDPEKQSGSSEDNCCILVHLTHNPAGNSCH